MIENKLNYLKDLTILLVEDDAELLKNLKATLSIFFKEIITANNGAKALQIYQDHHIDMIITDYVMPIMNGYELCLKIREINKKIPIVIISNYTDKEKLLKAIPLNLCDYLIKPIDYTTLTATLLNLLQRIQEENILLDIITSSIKYNSITKELINNDKSIPLTKSEIKTLELLLKHKNSIVSTDNLSVAIDNEDNKSEQAIKSIIHRLRKKLGKDTIINIQSFGYILRST